MIECEKRKGMEKMDDKLAILKNWRKNQGKAVSNEFNQYKITSRVA